MFRRRTVFIVGAGASKEVGLPIGSELASQIADICDIKFEFGRTTTPSDYATVQQLEMEAEGDSQKVRDWLAAMKEIRRALPFKDSIDAVIDQHYDRAEVAQIGKYMIARLIMEAERKSRLGDAFGTNGAADAVKSTWLHGLCRMLFEGVRKDDLADLGRNLTIICFNYDRCIERYLTYAISEAYGVSGQEAIRVAAQVRIIHAYGSLGALPGWPTSPGTATCPFGGEGNNPWKVSKNLRTFSESVDGDTDETIKDVIMRGEQYVYLGLSFGRQNMELLTIDRARGNYEERGAFASAAGQSEQARETLCRLIRRTYGSYPVRGKVQLNRTKLELDTKAKQLLDLHWHNILE